MRKFSWAEDLKWAALLFGLYLLFWGPTFNVQSFLTTGDMGRDLYAFQRTLLGATPCRDFWWSYGPLMPLYYDFWFLLAGVNILSARIGLAVILLLCSLLTYRVLRLFAPPPVAFLSGLAFLSLDIMYTFNHVGAFPFLVILVFSLWKFFLTRQIRWCYLCIPFLICVALVKISAGVVTFLAFFLLLCLNHFILKFKKPEIRSVCGAGKIFLLSICFITSAVSIYSLLYRGLPFSRIDECLILTIGQAYRANWGATPWINFKHLILWFLVWDRRRLLWIASTLILGALALLALKKKKNLTLNPEILIPVIAAPLLIGMANSADYFVDGMIRRIDFWFFPMLVLLMGLLLGWAASLFKRKVKMFFGVLIFLALLYIPSRNSAEALALRIHERYLDLPHGKVYVGGPLSDAAVISKGSRFIIENTQPSDSILAIPYDSLYCFLSGRKQAVRELMFMEHSLISEARQEEIIHELQNKKVPLVVISNRYRSRERGMGEFGRTHCRRLAAYIYQHYQEVQTFGPWDGFDRGFHAIKIYKLVA